MGGLRANRESKVGCESVFEMVSDAADSPWKKCERTRSSAARVSTESESLPPRFAVYGPCLVIVVCIRIVIRIVAGHLLLTPDFDS